MQNQQVSGYQRIVCKLEGQKLGICHQNWEPKAVCMKKAIIPISLTCIFLFAISRLKMCSHLAYIYIYIYIYIYMCVCVCVCAFKMHQISGASWTPIFGTIGGSRSESRGPRTPAQFKPWLL